MKCSFDAYFGKELGDLWYSLIKTVTPYSPDLKRYVWYNTGQPMGAYSSWAALNMTHHWVVRFVAYKLKVKPLYQVLGDDLVICGDKLAQGYLDYMSKLGVDINQNKSIVHSDELPSSAEFARHLVMGGKTIGTISPNLLYEILSKGQYHILPELVLELRTKMGIEIILSDNGETHVPTELVRLLSRKGLEELVLILTCPEKAGLNMPITRGPKPLMLEGYKVMISPWVTLDEAHVTNCFKQKWLKRAQQRLDELNELDDSLSHSGTKVASGYLLDNQHHPIKYMIANLKQELSVQAMAVAFMNPTYSLTVPTLMDTSIDLLNSVLTKGIGYRDWRNSKEKKQKVISKYIKEVLKSTPKAWVAPPAPSWEAWGSAWENQSTPAVVEVPPPAPAPSWETWGSAWENQSPEVIVPPVAPTPSWEAWGSAWENQTPEPNNPINEG
jgi:hypothetical protein